MAFRLTKRQIVERDALAEELREKADALAAAIVAYNEVLAAAVETVNEALDGYNEAIETAREFVTDIAESAREEYGEKSERWQTGDKGTEADAWIDAWETVSLDDVEIDVAEPLDEIDTSEVAGALEDLPDQP